MSAYFDYKKILFLIICCLNFYSVIFEDVKILGYIFYYVIPIIFFMFNYEIIKQIFKHIFSTSLKYYLYLCFFVGLSSLIIPYAYGTQDFSYFTIRIMQFVKEGVKMCFLLVYFVKYISKDYNYKLFMKYYIVSTCIYVCFTIFTILFPSIRDYIISQLSVDSNTERLLSQENYFTRFGWSGFSGFTFTLKASISVIFSLYFIILDQEKHFFRNLNFLSFSLLGNLFYGRIGLMVSGLLILLTMGFVYKLNPLLAKKIILVLICFFFLLLLIAMYNKKIQMWLYWAFQNFVNFFSTGSMETSSLSALENMYILPEIKTFLFGNGYYTTDVGYYMNIDVGLLRPVYFGGVFFQLLRYSIPYILYKNQKTSKIVYGNYLIICFMILFVLFEMKGEVIFPIINLLFIISLLCSKKEQLYD